MRPRKASAPLSTGKIPVELLRSAVLSRAGALSKKVVTPARAGVDFAAVKAPRGFLIVASDPVTGVTEGIGTYAVRVSANDVATSGSKAEFAESVILLPEGSSASDLEAIARQVDGAAKESGIAVVGGHTEVTPGLRHPIVMVTAFAFANEFVTSGGARPGDVILMTKTAGIEGTSELAREHDLRVPASTLRRARGLVRSLDVSGEAVAAFATGRVHGMHDCTEGGVLGGVYEMSLASGLGFTLYESRVKVAPETRAICNAVSVDPLRLIGSGSLLIAVSPSDAGAVEDAVRPVTVTRVGEFTKGGRVLVKRDGSREELSEAPIDELWRLVSRS